MINKILQEALDFKNIETFKHKKREENIYGSFHYSFKDEKDNTIDVEYEKIYSGEFPEVFNGQRNIKGFNVGFTVNNNDEQSHKTDYKSYIKIISTIIRDILSFIKKIKPNFIGIATVKNHSNASKKGKIYNYIIDKYRHEVSSEYEIIPMPRDTDFEGIIIRKKDINIPNIEI